MANAYKILIILVFAILVTLPSRLLGYPLLGALGYTNKANGSVIIGSILHIAGLITLFITSLMNVYTIAVMVVITESIVFIIRTFYVWKYKILNNKETLQWEIMQLF